ncbi:MAG TPA: hypothetical protein VEB86_15685 [Chryseosolibacter sp.]|nr:hypothetical protein [Chryseosolibacter sp.]
MKQLIVVISLLLPACAHAQDDSTRNFNLNTDITIATRNVWRGLDYGSSPSVQGTLAIVGERFELGTWGTTTLNGSKSGYGTWVELFATAKYKNFALTIDDYFFFNADDSLNNYLDWRRDKTQHFIEARLKFDSEKLDLMAGYAFYKNKADETNGLYFEAEYAPLPYLSFLLGAVTSSNWLSFYDEGGITTIGVAGKRSIPITETFSPALKASLIFNPNYEGSVNAPGVGTNPVYVVMSLTF